MENGLTWDWRRCLVFAQAGAGPHGGRADGDQPGCRSTRRRQMAPERRRTGLNVTQMLARRSRGGPDVGALLRHNMKVFRTLLFQVTQTPAYIKSNPNGLLRKTFFNIYIYILQDNRSFVKVWSKSSKSTIMYESGKIYFENYLNCYSW